MDATNKTGYKAIKKQNNYGSMLHIVYLNGQSVLTPKLGEHTVEVRYTEPEFKKLMEE